ncbi:MAG: glycine zipper 2TM domain-containing protein [Desulfobacteraceae bacterium]|nr:glycine zipper 2TM domain-containing protein [Desulfobacteraceae bacterium]
MKKLFGLVLIGMFLLSCANTGMNKGQTGAIGGAAAGALIGQAVGRDTTATLIGAAAGGLLGYIVGNEMDKADRQRLSHTYESTPSGQTSSWVNPDTGNRYTVTPQPAYTQNQRVCREAEIIAVIDGKQEKTYTTACRDANGDWVLQK